MGDIRRRGLVMIAVGVLCVAAAFGLFLYNMWDDARAGIHVTEEKERLIELVIPESSALPENYALPGYELYRLEEEEEPEEYRAMPVKRMDGESFVAILSIPSLNLELPVRNLWTYPGLRESPCRYTGSAYMDDLVICAHNYSQHFGRIKDLEQGSEVLLVDMDGELFTYTVETIETLGPKDFSKLLRSGYDLTLFTCTLGGASRVTVRCTKTSRQ